MGTNNATHARGAAGEYANRSVLIGASLLRTISKLGGGAGLQQIAEAAGLLPARTHRYLLSLVKSGLLDYDAAAGRYDLGALVLELGLTALGRIDAVRLGSEAIRKLTDRLDLVSTLSVWGSNGATIVKCEMARNNRIDRIREGLNLPLLSSATGRIFYAFLAPEETREFLDEQDSAAAAEFGSARALTAEEREALRVDVQKRGIAANSGETRRGALAAPVFNYEGRLVMVITVIGDAHSTVMELGGAVARDLLVTAENLSRQMGAKIATPRSSHAA